MKTSHKHTHTRTKTQSSTVTTLNKLRVHHRMSKYSPMCRNRAWLTSQKMVLSYKKTASVCTFSMQHSDAFTNHSQLQTFSKAHKQHDRVLFKKNDGPTHYSRVPLFLSQWVAKVHVRKDAK